MDTPGPEVDRAASSSITPTLAPLADGWFAHRRTVRRRGPWWALAAPLAAGGAALTSLWGSAVWWRGALGLLLAIAGAPLLPVAGVPVATDGTRVLVGAIASAVAWWCLGWVAARRATRTPGASWPEWRREYLRLSAGFVVGGWLALGVAGAAVALRSR